MSRPASVRGLARQDVRAIRTPEGVVLPFRIATAGERLGAHLIDLVILLLGTILLVLLGVLVGVEGWLAALWILAWFLFWNGYFLVGELGPYAATVGKRRLGLRVMDAEGGVLTPEAVVARNLMRNLELTVPLTLTFAPQALWPGAPGWARLAGAVWAFALAGLPLFNRWRLRPGDLVGGTLVVRTADIALLSSVAERAPEAPALAFTDEQLDVYGIYELQVLEDVLRHGRTRSEGKDTQEEVARRIARKIGHPWRRDHVPATEFLQAFYTALRDRLERRLLLGRRKEDKFST